MGLFVTTTKKINGIWQKLSSTKGKIYDLKCLHQKKERKQINNLKSQLEEVEKEEQTNPKASQRKEITKLRAEISKMETKKKKKNTKDQ